MTENPEDKVQKPVQLGKTTADPLLRRASRQPEGVRCL